MIFVEFLVDSCGRHSFGSEVLFVLELGADPNYYPIICFFPLEFTQNLTLEIYDIRANSILDWWQPWMRHTFVRDDCVNMCSVSLPFSKQTITPSLHLKYIFLSNRWFRITTHSTCVSNECNIIDDWLRSSGIRIRLLKLIMFEEDKFTMNIFLTCYFIS